MTKDDVAGVMAGLAHLQIPNVSFVMPMLQKIKRKMGFICYIASRRQAHGRSVEGHIWVLDDVIARHTFRFA